MSICLLTPEPGWRPEEGGGTGGSGRWVLMLLFSRRPTGAALHVSYEGARHPRVRRGNSDGPVSAWILFGRCRTRHAHRADLHSKLRSCGVCLASRAGMLLLPCAVRPGFSRPTMRLARSRADVDRNLDPPPPLHSPSRSDTQRSLTHLAVKFRSAAGTHAASTLPVEFKAHQRQGILGPVAETAFASPRPAIQTTARIRLPGLSLAGQFPLQSKHC